MLVPAKREVHYEKEVWVNPTTEAIRRQECLCIPTGGNCANFKPGEPDHCSIAQSLYEVCRSANVALAVTRCPLYQARQ